MYSDKVTEPIESIYDIGPAVKQTITVSRNINNISALFGVLRLSVRLHGSEAWVPVLPGQEKRRPV